MLFCDNIMSMTRTGLRYTTVECRVPTFDSISLYRNIGLGYNFKICTYLFSIKY